MPFYPSPRGLRQDYSILIVNENGIMNIANCMIHTLEPVYGT